MDGWKCPDGYELYEPVAGQRYFPGTMYRLKDDPRDEWCDQDIDESEASKHGNGVADFAFIYCRPISAKQPLDIDLPYLLKKSAACSPEIQSQIVALKAKFAEEVCKLIEADEARRKGGAA